MEFTIYVPPFWWQTWWNKDPIIVFFVDRFGRYYIFCNISVEILTAQNFKVNLFSRQLVLSTDIYIYRKYLFPRSKKIRVVVCIQKSTNTQWSASSLMCELFCRWSLTQDKTMYEITASFLKVYIGVSTNKPTFAPLPVITIVMINR